MRMGIFDVIGPIMHGPSSNHTGGVNRIGYMAWQFMGGTPKQLHFLCHPLNIASYKGQHSDVALMAGCLGIREDDPRSAEAMRFASEAGIGYDFGVLDDKVARNAYYVHAEYAGIPWEIDAVSPGGGFIEIIAVNGIPVYYDGGTHITLFADSRFGVSEEESARAAESCGLCPLSLHTGTYAGRGHILLETAEEPAAERLKEFLSLLGVKAPEIERRVRPIRRFVVREDAVPCYDSFAEMLKDAASVGILEAAFKYEHSLSGADRKQVMEEMLRSVDVDAISLERGLKGENPLIAGFASGSDALKVQRLGERGKSVAGSVFNAAMRDALAVSEVAASAGRIVAAPTSGAAGTLPGTLFAIAENYSVHREKLAEAFIVAGLLGCLMSKECMFTGSGGGCMGEIGAAASMAAGAAVYLMGGTPAQIVDASAIAMKNCFGLSCDQPASPVEVPCIKRNAMGAAVALMGAELALAGVTSVIPMDEVIVAFRSIQDHLPVCMRAGFNGGLSVTETGIRLRKEWNAMAAGGGSL